MLLILKIDMIFRNPIKLRCVLNVSRRAGWFQNSKSKENCIWRAPVPAMGCLNPGIGVKPEPKKDLTCEKRY